MLDYKLIATMPAPAKLFDFKETYNKYGTKILGNCLAATQFTRFLCSLTYYNWQHNSEFSHSITLPGFGRVANFVGKFTFNWIKKVKDYLFDSITLTKASAINVCNTESKDQSCTCESTETLCKIDDEIETLLEWFDLDEFDEALIESLDNLMKVSKNSTNHEKFISDKSKETKSFRNKI
jgi:hypothetical protein